MTQVLHTAALAGIPDRMADRTCTAAGLAADLRLNADALERFLRMMVVLDLLVEEGQREFRLSEAGHLLRSDHPRSLRERVLYIGAVNYPVAGAAIQSLQSGGTAFEHVFGMPFFEYLGRRPDIGQAFNGLMQQGVETRIRGVLAAFDFSQARRIVDIGGGNGSLLSAILETVPDATGEIMDLPPVIAQARDRLASSSVGRRIEFAAGDLFEGPYPEEADLYLLSNILHDWDDERAQSILRRCRHAMGTTAKLLLVEEILPEAALDSPVTVANDYSMLLLTGGRERTELQYRSLLESCGLQLGAVLPFEVPQRNGRRGGNWAVMRCDAV